METHYQPDSSPTTARQLASARAMLAEARECEQALGQTSPENEPVSDHLQAALDALVDGWQRGDDRMLAEGVVMVQDAELRLRCDDGTPVAKQEIRSTMYRIRDWVRELQNHKNPPVYVAAAQGVVEALQWVLGSPDPDGLVRMLLKQAAKREGIERWRKAQ